MSAKKKPVLSIHLHTAATRMTEAGEVRADAGEDLIVGKEITAARAAHLVDTGGAVVIGGGTIDPLDHDGDGVKGGQAPGVGGEGELQPRELADGEMLQDASADLGLTGEPIPADQLQASEGR